MRVILGKQGKSRILETQMKQLNREKILMIDAVGLHTISHNAAYTIQVNSFQEIIAALSELEKDKEILNKIDYVVLSLNSFINDSDKFLNWKRRLGKRFIITIQENEVEKVLVFDMSLPE